MKSMIAAVALVLCAAPAMAQDQVVSYINDNYPVDFLSWCDGNKVVAQNPEGKIYVRANCEEAGLVCKVYDAYRFGGVTYTANCEKAK